MKNLISIIVPCYNGEPYAKAAIDSVRNQTSYNWECIIVDDGSTDNSLDVITKAVGDDNRFMIYHTKNFGVAHARNLAISKSNGKYILPFDIDDILRPEAIECFTKGWIDNPDATLLVPQIYKDKQGIRRLQKRTWRGYNALMFCCSPTNSSCYKKSDWKRIGGYRDGTRYEDWEFWIRLLHDGGKVVNIDNVLLEYHVHEGSRVNNAFIRHHDEMRSIISMNPDIYKDYKIDDDDILVVIPYLAKKAQGTELEMAVAGWRKHFMEKFKIVVVGDYHPVVDSGDDIMFIYCPRLSGCGKGDYLPHLDHVNKFRTVHTVFPDSKGFIYTCDDIYAVKDFTLDDVKKPKVRVMEIKGSYLHSNLWVRDNYRTRKILEKHHLPTMSWVCHLPVYYEWDKLLTIYDKYKCDTKSRVVEQLYFNTYFADSDYVVLEENGNDNEYQYRFWSRNSSIDVLKNAIGNKIWIANTEKSWKKEMEDVLREYYGL